MYNIKIYLKLTQEFNRLNKAKSRASKLGRLDLLKLKDQEKKKLDATGQRQQRTGGT